MSSPNLLQFGLVTAEKIAVKIRTLLKNWPGKFVERH